MLLCVGSMYVPSNYSRKYFQSRKKEKEQTTPGNPLCVSRLREDDGDPGGFIAQTAEPPSLLPPPPPARGSLGPSKLLLILQNPAHTSPPLKPS